MGGRHLPRVVTTFLVWQQRGFEIHHDALLLTIFSASNYGGVCRNRGGVLIFDEVGPKEVPPS